jgi:hypothetical protein
LQLATPREAETGEGDARMREGRGFRELGDLQRHAAEAGSWSFG